ncbi:Plant intracellular Ras-group-related LRR protein [Quillaja saponaria]|uniref:Plant intracellular Ras-group-related LRR protein n=1 Tax=Quillaja saponaria TaxID=32244 RepID=A0AAD7L8C1_QUISA|nr:Plant intracellular Ras-group-related LRR protein [Quillaja saponaria]
MAKQEAPSPAYVDTVKEITGIYRSLPPRPSIEEVEAAISVLKTVNSEEQMKLDEISKQDVPQDVPDELFSVLLQVRKTVVLFQSHELKREALHLLELDKMFKTFDDLIQRASDLVSGDTQNQKLDIIADPVEKIGRDVVISDGNLVKKREDEESDENKLKLVKGSSIKASSFAGDGDSEKLSLMKMEWLPVSIGKLSDVTELDLSENRIMALPPTIGGLKSLLKLDIHSNQLINLPDSFGELINLTDLDLHANRLRSLPASFGNLTNLSSLDLSSNHFTLLPNTIGSLTSLKRLNVETNELEELPYTIGSCSSLLELKLDFNQLKALPEAVGKLECLEILTVHYNRIKRLPTTVGNLSNLRELDVSFNELESIPENLCFAVRLKKLNVGNNFADLRALPRSIGNLEMLEELDISDDQIRELPESFRFLSKLRVFRADETPLEVPPRQVAKLGAQAVVEYMADFVAKRDAMSLPIKKKKGFLFWLYSIFCSKQNSPSADQNPKVSAKSSMDHKLNAYIWDMDETPILLKSLLNGTYAVAFNGLKDVQKSIEIGKMWEKHILHLCDDFFFYEQIENYNKPFLDALSQYDDGRDLSDYDFNQDGLDSPHDDANKKKDLDIGTGWLSSALAFLKECSSVNKEATSSIAAADATADLSNTNMTTHGNIYSSWEVGKLQCFRWIKERYSHPNVHFCVIGDGWEECAASQTMRWPFVKIDLQPGNPHRFPGLTLRTVGHYISIVYGNPITENDEE